MVPVKNDYVMPTLVWNNNLWQTSFLVIKLKHLVGSAVDIIPKASKKYKNKSIDSPCITLFCRKLWPLTISQTMSVNFHSLLNMLCQNESRQAKKSRQSS
jgi:hypothetical protein